MKKYSGVGLTRYRAAIYRYDDTKRTPYAVWQLPGKHNSQEQLDTWLAQHWPKKGKAYTQALETYQMPAYNLVVWRYWGGVSRVVVRDEWITVFDPLFHHMEDAQIEKHHR